MAPPTNAVARWAIDRWYARLLLFPTLMTAILLAALAPFTSWWLAGLATVLGVPALAVVLSAPPHEPIGSGWHLR